jgi:hypothetical protein
MPRSRFALLPVLAAVLLLAPRALAEDAVYTVRGVHLDASAYSASAAQSLAFAQGRPKAWQILFRRLTRQQDWIRQPALDDVQIQRLIRNYAVTNERRSTTRYTADINYYFNPAAIAKVLKDANIAFTQESAHRILLVPMNPSYAPGSAWTNAFIAPRFAEAVVPFSLPAGEDAGALAHVEFATANWPDLSAVALRIHATEAVLVLLDTEQRLHRLSISLKRVGLGEQPTQSNVGIPYVQTALSTYPAAADTAMSAIAEMWKKKSAVDFSERGTVTVDVHVGSLSQWAGIQMALSGVPNVTGVRVEAMDIGEARLVLSYLGTLDQLHEALSEASLQLSGPGQDSGVWLLRPGAPLSSSAQAAQQPAHPKLRP